MDESVAFHGEEYFFVDNFYHIIAKLPYLRISDKSESANNIEELSEIRANSNVPQY